jgi:hypothetical protein
MQLARRNRGLDNILNLEIKRAEHLEVEPGESKFAAYQSNRMMTSGFHHRMSRRVACSQDLLSCETHTQTTPTDYLII